MNRQTREALAAARRYREEQFQSLPNGFYQSDYEEALVPLLQAFAPDAYRGFVHMIAEKVDRESSDFEAGGRFARPGHRQAELFDLEGEYRLGEGKRIAKRLAHLQHAETALAIDAQNLEHVRAAHEAKAEEVERLRAYWTVGRTKVQAVEAYNAANGG